MAHKDKFDGLLDDALSEYRDAEPLAGMEERVLGRLRSERDVRLKRWRRWALAACAAMIAVTAGIALHSRLTAPVQPEAAHPTGATKAASEPPIANQPAFSSNRQLAQLTRPRKARTDVQPAAVVAATWEANTPVTREQFPTPAPLSPEEHALLTLARTHPDMLVNRFERDGKIIIPLIDIQLLPEPNGDSEGDN